jgi:hypothetical protein
MPQFHITVYLNVGPDNVAGLHPGDPVATDTDLQLTVTAAHPDAAAELAYAIGNRIDTDDNGHRWPTDVRTVSVGDLIQITGPSSPAVFRAVAAIGVHPVVLLANPIVPLAGTRATSRRTVHGADRRVSDYAGDDPTGSGGEPANPERKPE